MIVLSNTKKFKCSRRAHHRNGGVHRAPLREPERFVTQHAQSAEHELHTQGGEGGCGHGRRDTRQHLFLRQPRSGAQGSTLQRAGYARIEERSLIGELAHHRVRVGHPSPQVHQWGGDTWEERAGQGYCSGSREKPRWRSRAARGAQARNSG